MSVERTTSVALVIQRMPAELQTIEGMAGHLATMAVQPALRPTAVAWFGRLRKNEQIALITSARRAEDARQLVYLVPDAAAILPHLNLLVVRRICDGCPELLEAVEPDRYMSIVRATGQSGAQCGWLGLIYEAIKDDREKLDILLDALTPTELAAILIDAFRPSDVDLLVDAFEEPAELEGAFDETFPLIREIAGTRRDLYQALLEEISAQLQRRYEYRMRERTQTQLQRRFYELWSGEDEEDDEIVEEE